MMYTRTASIVALGLILVLGQACSPASKEATGPAKSQTPEGAATATPAQENPLAKYLAVPGASTTLPVSAAKKPFPLEFVADARARFENFHYQMGGDHALYYNGHLSELMPTAVSQPNEQFRPLEVALNSKIGRQVTFSVKEGELTLDEYVVHPNHRVQGVMMIP